MARSLQNVQTIARGMSQLPQADLLQEPGLGLVNRIYRLMGLLFPWDELGATRTVANTTKGQESYPWLGFTEFVTIASVTVQSRGRDLWPSRLELCDDDYAWGRALREGTGEPRFYRVVERGGIPRIQLRPAPAWNGLRVAVSGTVAPAVLWTGLSRTVFNLPEADMALATLVAAALVRFQRKENLALRLIDEAVQMLEAMGVDADPAMIGEEIETVVAELPATFDSVLKPRAPAREEKAAPTLVVALAGGE